MSGFRLSVDQIVSAIELLDGGEQEELRMRLLGWLAGAPMMQPSFDALEPDTERGRPLRMPSLPSLPSLLDEDEMYLYDDLMAMMDE